MEKCFADRDGPVSYWGVEEGSLAAEKRGTIFFAHLLKGRGLRECCLGRGQRLFRNAGGKKGESTEATP